MPVFIKYLIARCQKQCYSAPCAFSHSFSPQNISLELKSIAIFSEFSQKCGKEGKMRDFPHDFGMVDTYGIGSTRDHPN